MPFTSAIYIHLLTITVHQLQVPFGDNRYLYIKAIAIASCTYLYPLVLINCHYYGMCAYEANQDTILSGPFNRTPISRYDY